ncbi:AfsR/SARP family transcriptional regulator [Flindersiella endophytica]
MLGPLQVHGHDGAVGIRPGATQRVLCVLLSRAGEYVSVTDLIGAQWPGDPPVSARQNTRRTVFWLRTALGDPRRIEHGPAGYVLRLRPEELDAYDFVRLLDEAEAAQTAGRLGDAARLFDQALALWRGNPYAGFEDCLFLKPEIERLNNLRLHASIGRAEVYLALGRHTKLIPELAQLLENDLRQERIAGLYMRALYAAGRQSDAQDVFWRTKNHLADELGADPTPDLQQLYEAILRGKLDAPKAPPPKPQPPLSPAPAQLPADVYGFAGRGDELARLDAMLATDERQPAAVVISAVSGTAGVGKTALAVHWAHRTVERFPDGQLYVNLRGFDPTGTLVEPADAVRGFLDAFGIAPQRIPADLDAQAALYRSLLAGKRVLVVLDNARDVDQIRPLLPGDPGCLALVTSRNDLTGLVVKEGARPLALDLLTRAESRQLLERRLGTDRIAAEPAAADDIITACSGLPLALAIVAARAVAQLRTPLRGLADDLRAAGRDSLDPFTVTGDPSSDVRAVFSWSLRHLTPAAQRLFRFLGLHPGPDISTPAAASLTGVPTELARTVLAELVHAHLVTEPTPGRHTLHDLLRAYAAELTNAVDSCEVRDGTIRRMLDHYLHTAFAADDLLSPARNPITPPAPAPGSTAETFGDYAQAMAWFGREQAVLIAVLGYATRLGLDTHVWQLAWSLDPYLLRRGQWQDLLVTGKFTLTATRRLGNRSEEARAYHGLAGAETQLGRVDDARAHLEQALRLLIEVGNHEGQAHTYRSLALISAQQGRHAEALDNSERALEHFITAGNRRGQASGLNAVGWCQAELGEYEQALANCTSALELFQELGERTGEANASDSLGYVHHRLGAYDEALACYRHALALCRELGERKNATDILVHLGDTQQAVGDQAGARDSWLEALATLEELGHPDADAVRGKLAGLDSG